MPYELVLTARFQNFLPFQEVPETKQRVKISFSYLHFLKTCNLWVFWLVFVCSSTFLNLIQFCKNFSLCLVVQQFYEGLSNKARPKMRSHSWSPLQEADLGQRLEAKLKAAEQKRWYFSSINFFFWNMFGFCFLCLWALGWFGLGLN